MRLNWLLKKSGSRPGVDCDAALQNTESLPGVGSLPVESVSAQAPKTEAVSEGGGSVDLVGDLEGDLGPGNLRVPKDNGINESCPSFGESAGGQ